MFGAMLIVAGTTGAAAQLTPPNGESALLSFGVGWWDALDQEDEAVDFRLGFRLEYRHDKGLFEDVIKPYGGLEVATDGSVWGGVGVLVDVYLGENVVLTGSFAPGLYSAGSGKDLDSDFLFNTKIEAGWRFADHGRLAVALSHLSHGGLGGDLNPGTEVLTLYYHLPVDSLM
jgi:hypothetical protein